MNDEQEKVESEFWQNPQTHGFALSVMEKEIREDQNLKELQRIYDSLPEIKCKRKCQEACGPIGMSLVEAANITRNSGRHELPTVTEAAVCSALTPEGRCGLYSTRPLLCRVYGLSKALRCPHGCRPKRWIGHEEAKRLFGRMNELSESNEVVYTHPALGAAIKALRDGISL